VTLKAWPAIVIVPSRAAPVFALTLKVTVPFPLPLAPEVTTIHDALLTAVHEQAFDAVTVIVAPGPPAALKL
jgi:hypothetical protein